MSRTKNSNISCSHPEYAQRSLFVFALRRRYPRFWRNLNEVWRAGGGGLTKWMREQGVVDPWSIEYVQATLELWDRDPDGPNATLGADHSWFGFPALSDSGVPDFNPVFDRPYLFSTTPDDLRERLSGPSASELSALLAEARSDNWVETVEEFRKRMREQFEARLTKYIKSIRSPYGYQGSPSTLQHADWTALSFGGLPYVEIARWDLMGAPHRAPEDTVRIAVNRFAVEIGLTLPTRGKGM
jgi:hypothetical protein